MNAVVLPVVAVQLAEPQTEYAAEMIEACTATLRQGRCELAPVAGEFPTAVARVSWTDTERTEVLVEVGGQADGRGRRVSRAVHFADVDPELERWRVVGITVATLAGDLEDSGEGEDDSPPPEPNPAIATTRPDGSTPPTSPALSGPPRVTDDGSMPGDKQGARDSLEPRDRSGSAWMSVSAASSVDPTAWRAGTWIRGGWGPARPVFVTLGGGLVWRPQADEITVRWEELSGGLAVAHAFGEAEMNGRVEGIVSRVVATSTGERERVSAATVLAGGRLGVGAAWPTMSRFAVVVSFELGRYSRGIRIQTGDDGVVKFPPSTYTVLVGGRWWLRDR